MPRFSRWMIGRTCCPAGSVVLIVALFGWGPQYRVSFWQQNKEPQSSQLPPAKFLSEAERLRDARAGAAVLSVSPIGVPGTALCLAGMGHDSIPVVRFASGAPHRMERVYTSSPHLWLRPPPLG